MNLRAVLLCDPRCSEWLSGELGDGAELTGTEAASLEALTGQLGRTQLLFVQFDAALVSTRTALVERLLERNAELVVIGVGSGDPDVVLAAMRAGARDFLVPGRDDGAAAVLVERALRRGGSRAQSRGKITAVLSAYADTGTAFLGEHLALAGMEALPRGEPVLLIDLSLPAGASLVFLNQTQAYGVQEAIQDAYRCDQTLVDTAFARHASGLHVLSLPETLTGIPEIDAQGLGSFLDVVRGLFAWVVVAADASLGVETLRAVVERSSQSLFLCEQSIVSVRANQNLLRSLRQAGCPLDHAGLVVDRYQKRLDLAPEKLAEQVKLPLVSTLSGDALNRGQAMNAGKPLFEIADRDDYSLAIRNLACQILERRKAVTAHAERGGILGWLTR